MQPDAHPLSLQNPQLESVLLSMPSYTPLALGNSSSVHSNLRSLQCPCSLTHPLTHSPTYDLPPRTCSNWGCCPLCLGSPHFSGNLGSIHSNALHSLQHPYSLINLFTHSLTHPPCPFTQITAHVQLLGVLLGLPSLTHPAPGVSAAS
eukprot:scaffold64514_cov20-Tisochrysis_lutea.AAC.1